MEKKRLLSVIMAVIMAITMLPSLVFAAAPAGELGGKLKIKGTAAVGCTLSADYSKAEPSGLTDDYVSFAWARQTSDSESIPVGTDKTYTVTDEDLGYKITLQVTGLDDMGITGSLTGKTKEIMATEEEALAAAEESTEEASSEETAEADASQGDGTEENMTQIGASEGEMAEDSTEDSQLENTDAQMIPEAQEDPSQQTQDQGMIQIDPDEETQAGSAQQGTVSQNSDQEANAEEPVYMAEASTEDGTQMMDFSQMEEGTEDTEAQYVTITNTGTAELNFDSLSPEHFMVQDVSEPLEPGESVSLWVQPRAELAAGEYDDVITYSSEEGAAASFEAKVTVTDAEEMKESTAPSGNDPEMQPAATNAEDPEMQEETGEDYVILPTPTPDPEEAETDPNKYSIIADPAVLPFADLTEGYESVAETQSINVENDGTDPVTLVLPTTTFFELTPLLAGWDGTSDITLKSGESVLFNVQPVLGLKANELQYEEEIAFGIAEDSTKATGTVALVTVKSAEQDKISVKVDPDTYEFASKEVGYTEIEQTTVTVTNDGNVDLTLAQPAAGNFAAGDLSSTDLPAGESVTFTLQPEEGLEAGNYDETFDISAIKTKLSAEEAESAEYTPVASVNAKFKVTSPEPVYQLDITPTELDFGSKEAGYAEAPKSQSVTVTNYGNTEIHLGQPSAENFKVGSLSAAVIKPGESSTFKIKPRTGLERGTYQETITIPNEENVSAKVVVTFAVTKQVVKLTAVRKAADITGLKNGVNKSQKGLNLPSTVKIETTNGTMKADVNWDIKGCAYDPSNKDAQSFTVKGKVTLPSGIENPDEISLITSVQVSVKSEAESYDAKVPGSNENMITGIEVDGVYTTESKISFTAIGAGMDNTSPHAGDVRFLPTSWTVLKTNSWNDAPYTATFGIVKAGSYTLSVTFDRQKFNGNIWVNTGAQDKKSLGLTIKDPTAASITATPTPVLTGTDATRKNAVQTGDTTNILPFIIILIIAAGCIAGIVIYRKKK